MKRILFLVELILVFGFVSAVSINYANPTPADNSKSTYTSFVINTTIFGISNISSFIFNWDGTDYSLYDSSLVLMLGFNNNSAIGENSSYAVDSSAYRNNGTITGALYSSGKYNPAISFSNNSDGITIPDFNGFHNSNFTITMWVNLTKYSLKQIEVNGDSSYVLLQDGNVYSIGYNNLGQLGDGTTTNRVAPVLVSGNYNFSSLADSGYPGDGLSDHMCGLLVNGTAMCWGYNAQGELGDNSTTQRNYPVAVSGGYNFSSLYVGRYDSCGLFSNGTLMCWGYNLYGEVGDNTTTQRKIPTDINMTLNFTSVSIGDGETCGVASDGSAYCWGRNNLGEVGDNTTTTRIIPTLVLGNYNFSKISAGNEKVCGILTNGSAYCWGAQGSGGAANACMLGSGLGNNECVDSWVPTPVYGNYNYSFLEANYFGYCGILTNGTAMCWAENSQGEIGDNTADTRNVPTPVYGNYNFSSISVGQTYSCGILTDGNIMCWGEGSYGGTGKGILSDYFSLPLKFGYGTSANYSKISAGYSHTCGLLTNGTAMCWGSNGNGQLGDNTTISEKYPQSIANYSFLDLFAGYLHTCGILTNGTAMCWGDNYYGEIGDNTTTERDVPTPILGDYNFSGIFIRGQYHNCGLLVNGSVVCWGDNRYAQLGSGTSGGQSPLPMTVTGGYNFSKLSLGFYHNCGILTNGTIMCWGDNRFGEIGDNTTTIRPSPVPVYGGYNFTQIFSGAGHTCGLLTNGTAMCWGFNNHGQIGDNSTTNRLVPVPVYGGYNFSSISTGQFYSCGVLTNGSAMCWGYNAYGALGNGTTDGQSTIPVQVSFSGNFSTIYPGLSSAAVFAFLTDGTIISWGDNRYGQQVFSAYNNKIPTEGFFKGNIFGKSSNTFKIASSFDGNLFGYASNGFNEVSLDSGWNFIALTFDGSTGKIYKDGQLYDSFNSPSLSYLNETSNLFIGSNLSGRVDELKMWNRTLSDSEIWQIYESNLNQINSTSWEFYSNESSLNVGIHSYKFSLTDLSNNVFSSALRYFTVYVASATSSSTDNSNEIGLIYRPNNETLKKGFVKLVKATQKIEIPGGAIIEIKIVDVGDGKVFFTLESNDYELSSGQSINVDTNGDGYYDFNVSLKNILLNGYANMEFSLISDQIPVQQQKNQSANSVGKVTGNTQKNVNEKGYIIAGIIVLLVLLLSARLKLFKKFYKNLIR